MQLGVDQKNMDTAFAQLTLRIVSIQVSLLHIPFNPFSRFYGLPTHVEDRFQWEIFWCFDQMVTLRPVQLLFVWFVRTTLKPLEPDYNF